MPPTRPPGPVVLAILDGWGIAAPGPGNAVAAAHTPVIDRLLAAYPHATLRCAGEDVGLPPGQMGNSEVGHLNLGAGFVVYQWLTRLDRAIADGSFFRNETFHAAINHVRATGGTLHLLGLVSDGGVHSHIDHLIALLRFAGQAGLARVAVHAFTDGRDTSPTSGLGFIATLEQAMSDLGVGHIATVSGRYYAMDRDHRWDRVQRAYDAMVSGQGDHAPSATAAIQRNYDQAITDEFLPPTVIAGSDGETTVIQPGDAVIFFNFRADRARQLTAALTSREFTGFARAAALPNLYVATMARYEAGLPV
ncbi:MAG: phosphoglycerate mutase (2,3-diphosphoglycerate-independent), partial [Chloroflexia bacterium]|nr:phosphoglycerate mutase (2,3-diphosphoglycerate-independent) [Chloroflexia bacterium]